MDSLICQAYFNPALMIVMNQLIIGGSAKPVQGKNKRDDGDFTHVKTSNLYHVDVPK